MSRSILRDGDERGEKIVSEFLDKHFYIECEDFHRVVDKVQQIKGVDTTFVKNGFQYVCDEKAALKYVNKNLQTFSMELSFFNAADNISIGWLLDSNKINNSFLPVYEKAITLMRWIRRSNENGTLLKISE